MVEKECFIMAWVDKFKNWLGEEPSIITNENKIVRIFSFKHNIVDNLIMSDWAKHFREHYCLDTEIDIMRDGTGLTRSEYLTNMKFPDKSAAPGPSIRAGDFGEILVADYLEFIMNYWVPRTRYSRKTIKNESTKGSDIIGFKFIDDTESPKDTLAVFEAKANFVSRMDNRLNDAINDSAKDRIRDAESLNAIKQRFIDNKEFDKVRNISRFQNPSDKPYKKIYGAVALFSNDIFTEENIKEATIVKHPHPNNLELITIKGDDMMTLVHELYKRASDEA